MTLFGYFLLAMAKVLSLALNVFGFIVIVRALLSWVSPDPYNPIVRFIHNVTEPALAQIRKRIPVAFSGIDLSPFVLILAIYFLQIFLVGSLGGFATRLLSP